MRRTLAPYRCRLPERETPKPGFAITLTPEESHHLIRVRRAKPGETIDLLDGRGTLATGTLSVADGKRASVEVGRVETVAAPKIPVTLALALLKAGHFEEALQHATQLGTTRIVPLACDRSEVKLDAKKAEARREKWIQLAWETCKQCGTPYLPEIRTPVSLPDFTRDPGTERNLIAALDEEQTGIAGALGPKPASVSLLIGPAGDFSPREIEAARDGGFRAVTLGENILRAETAAITAIAVLQDRLRDFG